MSRTSKSSRHDPQVHGRVIAARSGMLSHAKSSCEFLGQTEQRLSHCLHNVSEWQGFLNEANYSRERDRADESGDRRKFDELKKVQRARRLSYFGWKLAALGALGQMYRRFGEYARDVRRLAKQMPDDLDTFLRDGAPAQWLVSPSTGGDQLALLKHDASNELGLDELERAYLAFVELNASVKNKGELKFGDEHVWQGKYEPFYFGIHEPFTLVWLMDSSDHLLLGSYLWHQYRDLLDDRIYSSKQPVYILQVLEQAFVAVNEPQYEQRRKGITGSRKGDVVIPPNLDLDDNYKQLLLSAIDLDQGKKRSAFMRLYRQTRDWIDDVEEFKDSLDGFIVNHCEHRAQLPELADCFERMVAKYNLLSAVALSGSIARLLNLWQTLQPRFDALARKLKSKVEEYTESHVNDVYGQLGAMQNTLGSSEDLAAKAAHNWLKDLLEPEESDFHY